MRIGMLEPPTREKFIGRDKLFDDDLVGVTLLAVIVNDTGWPAFAVGAEARRILGIKAVIADRERDIRINAARFQLAGIIHPCFKVFTAMAWSRVHETRTGIVGDMIAVEHRHNEFVAAAEALQRVIEDDLAQFFC